MSRAGKVLFLLSGLCLVGFVVARFLIGGFTPMLWIPLGLFVAGVIGGVWADRELYGDFLKMKTTKHGMNMGVMILMVLVGLSAVNYLSIRHYKTFDFSLAKINTLSDQSKKLLDGLDSELKITFFYKKGAEGTQENRAAFTSLIKKYQDYSSKIVLNYVEVNEKPDIAEEYGVNKGTGVVFLDYKGKRNRIEKIDEQEVTGALSKVLRAKEKVVYIVTGHAEGGLEDAKDPLGLSAMKNLLEGNRYQVKTLALATSPEVPKDADLIIIPGPKQEMLPVEIQALENYLKAGGSALLALDPQMNHGLSPLLNKVGVELGNDFVVTVMETMMGKVADPSSTPANDFSTSNPITKVFSKNEYTVFRMVQGLKKATMPAGITVDELIKTGENSYGFVSKKFDGGGSKGPFTLAMSLKGKWPEGGTADFNLVVVGDSDWMGNQMLTKNLNRDLLLNAVAALGKEENLISITPKEIQATEMTLTENNFFMFVWLFAIPLPIILLSTSGILWFRRRHA